MALTRTQGKAALKHVVVTVLDQSDDRELMKSLKSEGYIHVSDLTSLRETTIENLTYPEDDGTPSNLKKNQKGLLVAFCAFIKHRNVFLSLPIGDDWTSITQEDYDNFRVSEFFVTSMHGVTPAPSPRTPATPSTRVAHDLIADFKRGIKRDATLFSPLKDWKEFDSWQRNTVSQCQAQDGGKVLDPTYSPNTTEDRELFKESKSTCMLCS
jgi:hypothetical protein